MCVCVIFYFVSRYLRPKELWQRLRCCLSNNGGLLCDHSLSPSGAAGAPLFTKPSVLEPKNRETKERKSNR